MGKRILFSAIGGNDPVSSQTEYDGSMLHICRWYRPDIVYLYLSKEMLERHRLDNRYGYCIEQLGELMNHSFEIHYIEKPELEEVQEYDYYYEEFQPILSTIENSMEEDGQIYVNIASGTPAMKSALLMLAVMSNQRIKAIQVNTPVRSIQKHVGKDDDYDPEYYWSKDRDNEEGAANRCVEPKCQNLVDILKKNIIIKHISAYDYSAALTLAHEMRSSISIEAYDLIRMAEARKQLDISNANIIASKYHYDIFPIQQEEKMMMFEYALILQLKLYKKDYADFIRGLSPLLTDLFEQILQNHCGINIDRYCDDLNSGRAWNCRKLEMDKQGKEIRSILDSEFRGNFNDKSKVAASNLKPLLVFYLKDRRVKDIVSDLRDIEEKIRNIAAHEIVSITNERIRVIIGKPITMEQIFKKLQLLMEEWLVSTDKKAWSSYDRMNEYIVEKLNNKI